MIISKQLVLWFFFSRTAYISHKVTNMFPQNFRHSMKFLYDHQSYFRQVNFLIYSTTKTKCKNFRNLRFVKTIILQDQELFGVFGILKFLITPWIFNIFFSIKPPYGLKFLFLYHFRASYCFFKHCITTSMLKSFSENQIFSLLQSN